MIATLGNLNVAPDALLHAGPQRARELVDLGARIVDIELPDHGVPGPLEQRGDRVAEGRAAAMAHVQGPGGVGGDELDVHPDAIARIAPAVALSGGENRLEHRGKLGFGEEKVDEPGARDLNLAHRARRQLQRRDEALGYGAGRLLQ